MLYLNLNFNFLSAKLEENMTIKFKSINIMYFKYFIIKDKS